MVKKAKENTGECLDLDCKKKGEKFNFCDLHFEHFKFGVIKKDGTHPSDREKKLGHFEAHKARGGKK